VLAASIIRAMPIIRATSNIVLMMEEANTSETSVNFYQTTRRNNPEDSHLHARRRENLKSHALPLDDIRREELKKIKKRTIQWQRKYIFIRTVVSVSSPLI
jgi:hypothetical protein